MDTSSDRGVRPGRAASDPRHGPRTSLALEGMTPSAPSRLAVFGGSFDPLHNGHLLLAGEVVRQGLADEVLFVPAGCPPHKGGAAVTAAEHRLAMLELALALYPQFSTSDIELRKEGPSYTIETLESLTGVYPGHEVMFLLGADSLRDLHTWYRASELVNRFRLLVYPRPGVTLPGYATLSGPFGGKNASRLLEGVVQARVSPISATDVRAVCAAGGCLAGLVPESVQRYITEHRLYQKEAPPRDGTEPTPPG